MGRDEELEQLEKEIRGGLKGNPTPAIDQGDKMVIGDGTACFINQDRPCTPECRAFNPTTNGESPDSCTIISGITDIGQMLNKLVSAAGLMKKQQQDSSRVAPPPPDPTGKRKPK